MLHFLFRSHAERHWCYVIDFLLGHAIAHAVSCWLPIMVSQVQSQVRSSWIYDGHCGIGTGLLQVLWFLLSILIPPTAPQPSSSIIWGWYSRPNNGRCTKRTQSHPTPRIVITASFSDHPLLWCTVCCADDDWLVCGVVLAGKRLRYPCYKPWRPIGLREVKAPTLLRQTATRWRQGCQPYAPAALLPLSKGFNSNIIAVS
jgi:hypothetical protein